MLLRNCYLPAPVDKMGIVNVKFHILVRQHDNAKTTFTKRDFHYLCALTGRAVFPVALAGAETAHLRPCF